MGHRKKNGEPSSENYTILHALVEALQEKERKKNRGSILNRLKRHG